MNLPSELLLSQTLDDLVKQACEANKKLSLWIQISSLWPIVESFFSYPCVLKKIQFRYENNQTILMVYCCVPQGFSWRFSLDNAEALCFLSQQLKDIMMIRMLLVQ